MTGYDSKRQMAADKLHWSDCAVHNGPAYPAGECDCGAAQKTEREALKLALEVMQINLTLLEKIDPYKGQEDLLSDSLELTHEAIASVEAVLAQPAQEPVALVIDGVLVKSELPEKYTGHLYTTPPKREWVGLTDEEISNLWSWSMTREAELTATTQQHAFARAIEAKLKEKNNGA